MSKWKLYPIVGEIVDNKASITFEICIKCIPVQVQVDNDVKNTIKCNAIGPTHIVVDLKHRGIYNITWYIGYSVSYKHIINTNAIDKIVFVSCDFLEADVKVSMWDMINQANNNLIVHLGDQIYADKQYYNAKKIQKHHLRNHDNDHIIASRYYDLYANRYCETFNKRQHILSNNCNFFLWDDHEIVNNITINKKDNVCRMAMKCYKDYQHFELNDEHIINEYCWYKYIGDILMLAIERTSEIITVEQIIDALEYLNNKNVNKIILCFSCAIIPPPHGISGKLYCNIMGTSKFYNTNKLVTLLDWLFQCGKEVILVGGDAHFGLQGIYEKEEKKIQVLIASPITNHPSFDRHIIASGMKGTTYLNDKINLVVTSAKAKRCFGSIDIASFTTNITYSKYNYPHKLRKYITY